MKRLPSLVCAPHDDEEAIAAHFGKPGPWYYARKAREAEEAKRKKRKAAKRKKGPGQ